MSSRDWKYTLISTLAIMMLSGAIMGISKFLHTHFGIQLLILLIPILFILPYAVQKTQNTWVGITIHALVNGPAFIMVSLGVIG